VGHSGAVGAVSNRLVIKVTVLDVTYQERVRLSKQGLSCPFPSGGFMALGTVGTICGIALLAIFSDGDEDFFKAMFATLSKM